MEFVVEIPSITFCWFSRVKPLPLPLLLLGTSSVFVVACVNHKKWSKFIFTTGLNGTKKFNKQQKWAFRWKQKLYACACVCVCVCGCVVSDMCVPNKPHNNNYENRMAFSKRAIIVVPTDIVSLYSTRWNERKNEKGSFT